MVKMWSPRGLPFLKPACSLRNSGSRASEILSRITLLKTLLVIDNRMTPSSFLQRLMYHFFANLTINPSFQSPSVFSTSHIPSKISVKAPVVTSPPAFSFSALTQSAPGVFPDFMVLIAFLTSSASAGPLCVLEFLLDFFASLLKCVFHLWVCFASPMTTFPSTSFTGTSLFKNLHI